MSNVLIVAFATGCVLTAVESLIAPLGKWRGLLALLFSVLGTTIMIPLNRATIFEILASTFLGLTSSLLVEQTFVGVNARDLSGLPRRVPRP